VKAGQLTASVFASGTSLRVVHVSTCPDSGPACATGEVPPCQHDPDVEVAELRPVLELGLTPNLSVEAQLPVRLVRSRITYRRLDGTPFTPDDAELHHRNETLGGPGDAWLSGRAALTRGDVWLSAGVDLRSEAPERWGGVVQQDGNVGRTDVLVGGGAAVLTDAGRWGLSARVPAYQHYLGGEDHGGQLTYPVVVQVPWTRGWDVAAGFSARPGASPGQPTARPR